MTIGSDAKDEYDEAFTMAVHKDVRDGIVKDGVEMAVNLTRFVRLAVRLACCHVRTAQAYLLEG